MKKRIAMILVFLLILALAACAPKDAVLDESKKYDISADVHSLDIQINAADFIIEHGESFSVESNLKYLTVSEKDGVLTILDKTEQASDYGDAFLKLRLPENTVFQSIEIATGAARLTADALSANSLELTLGAGQARFARLNAYSHIEIDGGAGEITVISGTLNNLTFSLGAGKLDMTAALLGESEINFGVGESKLTLLGQKEDYTLEIEKGLGSITVDGETLMDSYHSGNGKNHVKIKGGIGAADVTFQGK